MKVVILAGGMGTRIKEEHSDKAKPMVEIGGRPILWHIMKTYSHYGFNEFVICLGYKGYQIKEYFAHYFLHECDVTFNLSKPDSMSVNTKRTEPWTVTLANTGLETSTGGRIQMIKHHVRDSPFMLTYGDGVADINIKKLVEYHESHGKTATVSASKLSPRFGGIDIGPDKSIKVFQEKSIRDSRWISAGFMVFNEDIFNFLYGPQTVLEDITMTSLAMQDKLMAYEHTGFFSPMDTVKDKEYLNELWEKKQAPWKVWND